MTFPTPCRVPVVHSCNVGECLFTFNLLLARIKIIVHPGSELKDRPYSFMWVCVKGGEVLVIKLTAWFVARANCKSHHSWRSEATMPGSEHLMYKVYRAHCKKVLRLVFLVMCVSVRACLSVRTHLVVTSVCVRYRSGYFSSELVRQSLYSVMPWNIWCVYPEHLLIWLCMLSL